MTRILWYILFPMIIISVIGISIISEAVYSEDTPREATGGYSEEVFLDDGYNTESSVSSTGITTPIPQRSFRILRSPVQLSGFYDDTSILRYVSRIVPLENQRYTPQDLVSISGAHIDEAGRKVYLRLEANTSLQSLASEFEREFGRPLVVISGYRSANYQQRMWDLGKCTPSLCAPPGYSEHQLGLAIDIFDATTADDFRKHAQYRRYIAWLQSNAHRFGWTQSYQKGVAIDTYEVEPWHWRYVGIPMATRLHHLGWTYAEYVGFQESIQHR